MVSETDARVMAGVGQMMRPPMESACPCWKFAPLPFNFRSFPRWAGDYERETKNVKTSQQTRYRKSPEQLFQLRCLAGLWQQAEEYFRKDRFSINEEWLPVTLILYPSLGIWKLGRPPSLSRKVNDFGRGYQNQKLSSCGGYGFA